MKRIMAFVLLTCLLFYLPGCRNSAPKSQLIPDSEIKSIKISSLPEEFNYEYDSPQKIKSIIEYFNSLNLDSDFSENPDEYVGRTWVITCVFSSGDEFKLYHSGNKFLRSENSSWYKMNYEEAAKFESLIGEEQ